MVVEALAQPRHRHVEPVVEVHEGVVRPDAMTERVAGHQLARLFEECRQDCRGLRGEARPPAVAGEFPGERIEGEAPEALQPLVRGSHRYVSAAHPRAAAEP